jgi:hypothetical protein
MIGELIVRQLVGLDEASVAEHRIHPFFGQGGSLPTQKPGKTAKRRCLRVSCLQFCRSTASPIFSRCGI